MTAFLEWLEGTAIATSVRASAWGYPAVEAVHLLGLATLVGAAVVWDLRLLGAGRRVPVPDAAAAVLPVARAGAAIAVGSGVLLFMSEATVVVDNTAFRWKLALLAVAVVNVAVFHLRTFRGRPDWDVPPPAAKVAAVVSLVVWSATVVAGRLIAYL